MEVSARHQPGLFEQRRDALAGRARVGGGLQHHQLPRLQNLRQRARGIDQRPQIRLAVTSQRSRHAHQHRVRLRQPRIPRRGVDTLSDLAQLLRGDILDVGVPRLDRLDLARIEIDRDHIAALLRERHRQRQAHITQPDHANGRHVGGQSKAWPPRAAASAGRPAPCARPAPRRTPRGSQPRRSRALRGSPTLGVSSGGRTSAGSTRR